MGSKRKRIRDIYGWEGFDWSDMPDFVDPMPLLPRFDPTDYGDGLPPTDWTQPKYQSLPLHLYPKINLYKENPKYPNLNRYAWTDNSNNMNNEKDASKYTDKDKDPSQGKDNDNDEELTLSTIIEAHALIRESQIALAVIE